jgi:hypothetical protein
MPSASSPLANIVSQRIIIGLGDIIGTTTTTVAQEINPIGPGVDSDNVYNAYLEVGAASIGSQQLPFDINRS